MWTAVDERADMLKLDRSGYIHSLVEQDIYKKPTKVLTVENITALLLFTITLLMFLLYIKGG